MSKGLNNGAGLEHSLCASCTWGLTLQGHMDSQQLTLCHHPRYVFKVPFVVRQCSAFKDRRQPDLYDMKEVAHVLVRGQRGKQVGFVTPDQYREMETDDES
jgi:hypothetical protein